MAGTLIEVRAFLSSDQMEARTVIESGLTEHFGALDSSLNPDLDDIHASYLATGGRFFVAECCGQLVGTCGLVLRERDAQLVRVSTRLEFRRRGVASALLQRCIQETRSVGCDRLIVQTQPEWAASVGFYCSHGFVPCGRDELDIHLVLELESP